MATITTPVTLLEAARTGMLSQRDSKLVEVFRQDQTMRPGGAVNFFDIFPFLDIPGKMEYSFQRELGLPTITPRGLNATVTRTVASTENVTEGLKIYPAEFIMDKALLRTEAGQQTLLNQTLMHGKAILQTVQNHIFKGDGNSSAHQFTGLQARITGSDYLLSEGSTDGGDALQIATLRQAIDTCYGPNRVIVCGKAMGRRLAAAPSVTTGVGSITNITLDQWGITVAAFDGIPIIPVAGFDGQDNILDFSETGAGGSTATATSVYVLSLGEDGVHGLRNGGLLDWSLPSGATGEQADVHDMMFLPGMCIKRKQAAIRIYGISNAAVIA